jgi:hypothetical protein
MPIDELPAAPDPATDTPQAFNEKAAAMVLAQRKLPAQINGAIAEIGGMIGAIGVIAAGGAFAIPYVFDTTTTDADPGAGKLRLSSATQNAATVMRLDLTSASQDYTTLIDTFDDSTSAVKGSIRLVKQGDITKWMTFNLTALATPSGYRNLTVVCTDSSTTSPFSNGDALMLSFQRTGDKGQDAVGALQLLGVATISAAVAQIDFLNIFSSNYDRYVIELQCVLPSAAQQLWMRLASAGVVVSTGYGDMTYGDNALPSSTQLRLTTETTAHATLTVHVRNVGGTSPTSVGAYGYWNSTVNAGFRSRQVEGACSSNSPHSGFRLFWSGGANFIGGTVRVFGAKNS